MYLLNPCTLSKCCTIILNMLFMVIYLLNLVFIFLSDLQMYQYYIQVGFLFENYILSDFLPKVLRKYNVST